MKKIIAVVLMCAIATGAVFAAGGSDADLSKFPAKPVNAMVAWAAGGGADITFRALAEVFPKYANGNPLVITNKGEAAGVPGIVDFMSNGSKDGYSVLHWNIAHSIKIHWDNVPFAITDFVPICQVLTSSQYVYVKADSKYKTFQDFIADAKANPGQVAMGNAGMGGGHHLAAVLLEKAAGIQLKHIPFAGGGPAVTGVLSGDCQIASLTAPEGISQALAGQARILAIFGDKRFAEFPNVPLAKEVGLNYEYYQWRGVVAPKGTPDAVAQKLEGIFKKCAEDPAYIQRIKSLSAVPMFADAKTFGALLMSEDKRLGDAIKEAKIGNRYK